MRDGATLRDHLKVAWESTGIKPEQLDYEELDSRIQYLWAWFIDLDYYRGSNGFSVNPITPTQIRDWCWICKIDLLPFELRAIKFLDIEYMRQQSLETKEKT